LAVAATDWIGATLAGGRYRITAKLGEGGMGVVYRAWDENVGHDVVVKVPKRSMMDDPGFAARFKDEIRSLIRLPHPHIVKVFDVGEHDGLPFAVMQFLPGGSLEDRTLDREGKLRPMPPATLTSWLPQVAKALQFMHAEKFIHRDVKPANILFDAQGNAYLSDFGANKALAGSEAAAKSLTGTGMVLGTPYYMAPELVENKDVDGRIDQYALAATIHEVLSGQKLFDGPTGMAIMVKHVNQPAPPLDTLLPGIPRALAEAVLRGLDKDPANRFKTCTALAAAVLGAVGGATAQPRAAGPAMAASPVDPSTAVYNALATPNATPAASSMSSPTSGTMSSRRPAVQTAAIGAAPAMPAVVLSSGAPRPTAPAKAESPAGALKWLKNPIGISVSVTGSFLVIALLAISIFDRGEKSPASLPSPKEAVQTPNDTLTQPTLTDLIDRSGKLAKEIEAELPPSADDIIKELEYTSLADLRAMLKHADNDRSDLASDPRLNQLRDLANTIENQQIGAASSSTADTKTAQEAAAAIKKRLAEIDRCLKTSISQSSQANAELTVLKELERIEDSWTRLPVSELTRSRAREYAAQQKNHDLRVLGACALLDPLDESGRQALMAPWDTMYSDRQRANVCRALIVAGNQDWAAEGVRRIDNMPQLLDQYNSDELLKAIQRDPALWQEARDTLHAHLPGPAAERLAAIFQPSAPKSPSMPGGGRPGFPGTGRSGSPSLPPALTETPPSQPTATTSPARPSQWTTTISLPGGSSLSPEQVNCSKSELTQIEKTLPKQAYSFPNEKLGKGALLVHSGWTKTRKEGLCLDGWTVLRNENGSPLLVAEFDNGKRNGPVRLWAADGKPSLYANYINDRLNGVACVFSDGLPMAIIDFADNRPRTEFAVDYSTGAPVAKPSGEAAPDSLKSFADAKKEFDAGMGETQQRERMLNDLLKQWFDDKQHDLITAKSKQRRQRQRVDEARAREASLRAARALTAPSRALSGDFSRP
jgi:tRNA A-37 threonylcarbamoyl transferase component Bud32